MNEFMMVTSVAVIAIFGLLLTIFGFMLLRGKPILIRRYQYSIMLLPIIVALLYFDIARTLNSITNGAFRFSHDSKFLIFWIVILLVWVIDLIKSFGSLEVYNVDKDIMFESLFEVLKKNNIEYEEYHGKIILKNINQEINIDFRSLPAEKESFQLIPLTKMGFIHLNKIRDKNLIKTLTSDLREIISAKSIEKFNINGLLPLILGIVFMLSAALLLIAFRAQF